MVRLELEAVILQAVQAKAAFFHDSLAAQGNLFIKFSCKSQFLCIVKIELARLNRAVRAAVAASRTTLVHHRRKSVGSMICSPRRADLFTRGLAAMTAHKGNVSPHLYPMHKASTRSIGSRDKRHVIFKITRKNTVAASIAQV